MGLGTVWTAGVLGGLAVMACSIENSAASPARPLLMAQASTPPFAPSYGYQPYNDRNPTGFFHPNGDGYGHYDLPPKLHGKRFKELRYRKFKGY